MLIDTQKVSPWYVLHRGFRLTKECRKCGHENSHYKAVEKDYSGILSRCENCGKEIVKMRSSAHIESPLNGDSSVNDQIFRRIRKGSGIVERLNGGVVQLLHS